MLYCGRMNAIDANTKIKNSNKEFPFIRLVKEPTNQNYAPLNKITLINYHIK